MTTTDDKVELTVRARVAEALEGKKLKLSDVHKFVLASKHKDFISYPYVCAIARGRDDSGEKADVIRTTISELVGVPVETLFAGLVLTKKVTLTPNSDHAHADVRTGGSQDPAPVDGVPRTPTGDGGMGYPPA